jgi:hypothetical protein
VLLNVRRRLLRDSEASNSADDNSAEFASIDAVLHDERGRVKLYEVAQRRC